MKLKMEKTVQKLLSFSIALALLLASCQGGEKPTIDTPIDSEVQVSTPKVFPAFLEDSAYYFIETQVKLGPRYPGSKGHYSNYLFLRSQLLALCDTVYIQNTTGTTFDNKTIPIYNLIGSFNPQAEKRILLCAHWDTRPFADQDDSASDKPILGANDGASGVGVLLEIARILKSNPKENLGIDIVFFDAEDWGKGEVENSFCLGSQYWAQNTHVPNYQPQYGILLDMVGGHDATFGYESYSLEFAPDIVSTIWNAASDLGYSSTFTNFRRGYVIDDHFYVHKYTNIPMVDIIQYDKETGFGSYWHTHDDNMSSVSKKTLKIVGETLIKVIYSE